MATPSSKLWQHSTPAPTFPRGAESAVKQQNPIEQQIGEEAEPRSTQMITRGAAESPILIASGSRSKKATPTTAPALNPRMRCSLSRSPSANSPPSKGACERRQGNE